MENTNDFEEFKNEMKKIVIESLHGTPTWYNSKQIMTMFHISRNTLQNYVNKGLPYRQFTAHGKLNFDIRKVEMWLDEQNKKPS